MGTGDEPAQAYTRGTKLWALKACLEVHTRSNANPRPVPPLVVQAGQGRELFGGEVWAGQ
jgi:hypothetical protein